MRKPLPSIDRAAWLLIRRFHDDAAVVAHLRSQCCACQGDDRSALEWRRVLDKVIELHFKQGSGRLN